MTKGYGFTIDDIDWSCPSDLEPYAKAYRLQMQQQDSQLYSMGIYALSAVSVAIEHNFAGSKAVSEYIKKPFLSDIQVEESKQITEEERIEMERNKQYMILKIMQANFELSKM